MLLANGARYSKETASDGAISLLNAQKSRSIGYGIQSGRWCGIEDVTGSETQPKLVQLYRAIEDKRQEVKRYESEAQAP